MGAPRGGPVPIGPVGAQAADARMGHHRALQRPSGEADGGGVPPGRVGVDRDVVVPGEPPASGLEPPDAFPHLFDPLPGAGLGKPFGEFGEGLPEAPGEAFDDAAFLGRALLGEAVRTRFQAVVGHDLVETHGPVRRGADAYGVFGVEVPGAFAADDQVPIPLPVQPTHALPGGDAAVRHHQGAGRGTEGVGHPRQGAVFAYVAGEHLGAAHEAAGVEHQSRGEQRAVGALVLGVSAPAFGCRPTAPSKQVLVRSYGVTVRCRLNSPIARSKRWRSIAPRCATGVSEARYGRIGSMFSKSVPGRLNSTRSGGSEGSSPAAGLPEVGRGRRPADKCLPHIIP